MALDHLLKARVDRKLYADVQSEAKRSGRSVGAVIRLALREHLARQKARR